MATRIPAVRPVTRDWQAQLRSGRLAAACGLAPGLVHELGSPISVIVGSCESALNRLPPSHPAVASLRAISRSARRCRGLLRGLQALARNHDEPPRGFELGVVLGRALALVEPQARLRSLSVRLGPLRRTWPLHGRPRELELAFVRLAVAAIEEAPEGGRLEAWTRARRRRGRAWVEVQLGASRLSGPALRAPRADFALAAEIIRRHGGTLAGAGQAIRVALPLAVSR